MRHEDSDRYLQAVDRCLVPMGFKRRTRTQEWTFSSGLDTTWVHLNFGLGLINVSFGVRYRDLEKRWPDLPGAVYGTTQMMNSLFQPAKLYPAQDGPDVLVADLVAFALPAAGQLTNRDKVIELLSSPNAADWPVPSFSHRVRLLPLLLDAAQKPQEALIAAQHFNAEAKGRDQILPTYDVFFDAFRSKSAA
jgi:hypothetical protein